MYQCRNHAVILRNGYRMENQPDAVIIMANPGSCSPSDKSYIAPVVQGTIKNLNYVSVEDDQTQRQLMRLMKLMEWNVLSIINLSDLCSGNMEDFGKKLTEVERMNYKNHSIFAGDRLEEMRRLLEPKETKLILAWGSNPIIRKLACNARTNLPKERYIVGLPGSEKWSFRHPFPMIKDKCKVWLEDMVDLLNKTDSTSQIAAMKDCNK